MSLDMVVYSWLQVSLLEGNNNNGRCVSIFYNLCSIRVLTSNMLFKLKSLCPELASSLLEDGVIMFWI